jgi:hypothetical protein
MSPADSEGLLSSPLTRARHPVHTAALATSSMFLLLGILGFVPGVTTEYDQMSFAGHAARALLGVFAVSTLHNLLHLAFGLVGLAMSRTASGARDFLIGGGVIYAILWLYGYAILFLYGYAILLPHGLVIEFHNRPPADFVPVATAGTWLHFLLVVGMIGLGVLLGRGLRPAPAG